PRQCAESAGEVWSGWFMVLMSAFRGEGNRGGVQRMPVAILSSRVWSRRAQRLYFERSRHRGWLATERERYVAGNLSWFRSGFQNEIRANSPIRGCLGIGTRYVGC